MISGNARPTVVKIGGSTLGSHDTTLEDIVALQQRGATPVVVHGGGNTITEWLKRLAIPSHFVRGLRVTDAESLPVVVAVLAGLVNKELVARLTELGARAVGLSGLDGGMIQGRILEPELGYVGAVVEVNVGPLRTLLAGGYLPVLAPVGIGLAQDDGGATPLNINADTVAGEVAAALEAEQLIFLTDVEGVQDEAGRCIHRLSQEEARRLLREGTASGGMIPKLEACLRALPSAAMVRIIDGRVAHALLAAVEGVEIGTRVG